MLELWWTHHLHAYLQYTILPLPFALVQPAIHSDLWQERSHCKEHAIQALFASSEWTRPNHIGAWGDNAPNIHQSFGWLDESRKIFAERPHREFLNSDHLEDHYSTIWASPALFGIVCAFSHIIMKRQLILSICLCNEKAVSFFPIGSGSLPQHEQKMRDQMLGDGDTNGVTHDRVLEIE